MVYWHIILYLVLVCGSLLILLALTTTGLLAQAQSHHQILHKQQNANVLDGNAARNASSSGRTMRQTFGNRLYLRHARGHNISDTLDGRNAVD